MASNSYKEGKDYLKTKEAEAKKINSNRGFFDSRKTSGMDLLQDEAWKENKQFDVKKRSQKDANELFILFFIFLLFVLFYLFK